MEIITSHSNTDLDALAAMVAAQKLYPYAYLVFPGKLSRNVEEFLSLHKDTLDIRSIKGLDLNKIKRMVIVDTKNPRRLGKLGEIASRPGVEIHIYDHHPRSEGDLRGTIEITDTVGATVTLLVEKIREEGLPLSPMEATIFALGIYGDTGSLVFTNTTPRDAAAVSFLLERGANLGVVSEFLGRPLTDEQKDLLKDLLISAKRHQINGAKILIAQAATEEFVVGLSLLTHTISEIERLDAVFTVVEMDDRVHIVGRSSVPQVNVNDILSSFGGGGHPAAASATVKGAVVDEISETLLGIIEKKVHPPLSAEGIMSSPVKTVAPDTTIAEAGHIMLRHGHTGLPVVKGEQLLGVISRRDVEKGTQHGLGHAPVKGFMTRNVIWVSPDMPVAEVQDIMIEHDIGRVPVVKNGKLVGIVSRTDVLRTLHGNIQSRYRTVYSTQPRPQAFYRNIEELMRHNLTPEILDILRRAGEMAEDLGYQVYTVGGLVRDLLLGVNNLDVDLVVEGNGINLAETMASTFNARLRAYPKFGTAEVLFPDDGFKIDVATARVEYYEYPAALPQVESSSIRHDLYRRDFTINAMAVALNEGRFGELVDFFGGREDLQYGLVRVLYNLSFIEDPTRILRAIRFEQRYNINIEPQTLRLIKEAVRQGVLEKVSIERLWDEIYHILMEPEAGRMISRLNDLQVWDFIFPGVTYWEVQPVLNGLYSSMQVLRMWGFPEPAEKWLPFFIAVLHWTDRSVAENICQRYHLNKRQIEKVLATLDGWREALAVVWKAPGEGRLSDLAQAILALPRESYPLLLTVLDEEWMRQRFKELLIAIRDSKPKVNGKYIKTLGYRPGPIFRRALDAVWRAKLDGKVKTEDEEKEFVRSYLNMDEGAKSGV